MNFIISCSYVIFICFDVDENIACRFCTSAIQSEQQSNRDVKHSNLKAIETNANFIFK